jgi:hypothetical protein
MLALEQMALRNLRSAALSSEHVWLCTDGEFRIAELRSKDDRTIVCCSETQQILAICSTALIFLLLLSRKKRSEKR